MLTSLQLGSHTSLGDQEAVGTGSWTPLSPGCVGDLECCRHPVKLGWLQGRRLGLITRP